MTVRSARRTRKILGALSIGALVLLTACAKDAPQDTLNNLGGPVAREQFNLFKPVFWIATGVFVFVEGLLIFATIKFRARSDRDVPVQVHGNKFLEITWTIIPALILAGISVPTVGTIFSLAETPKGNVVNIEVVARQWWWEYKYTDLGVTTANEMHIPLNRPVHLTLKSIDVIHSFWVPRLAGKQDVIPGRTNTLTIEADTPGIYPGQCAEFCALSHANMRLRVIAQPQGDFDAWVANQKANAAEPTDALAVRGKEIFMNNQCIFCHAVRGTQSVGRVGPDLTHLAQRTTFAGATFDFTTENLIAWVTDAPGIKPGAKMPRGIADLKLSPDDIRAIVAYLESLK